MDITELYIIVYQCRSTFYNILPYRYKFNLFIYLYITPIRVKKTTINYVNKIYCNNKQLSADKVNRTQTWLSRGIVYYVTCNHYSYIVVVSFIRGGIRSNRITTVLSQVTDNVVSSTHRLCGIRTHNFSDGGHWLHMLL